MIVRQSFMEGLSLDGKERQVKEGAKEVREPYVKLGMFEQVLYFLNNKIPTCTTGKVVKSSDTATGFSISYNKQ